MNKAIFSYLVVLFAAQWVGAQSFMGHFTDNRAGVQGLLHNPGNLADNRIKWEFNLFATNTDLATDYTTLSLGNVTDLLGDDGFDGLQRFPTDQNTILVDADILGPSLMFSLNEKSGLALTTRVRVVSNFNNVNGELFEAIYDGFPANNFNFSQDNLDFTTHAWGEIGLTYGRVLWQAKGHMLKGGATLKYLLGGGAVQGSSNTLNGDFDSNAGNVRLNGDFSYALTVDDAGSAEDFFENISPGFGADVGFVYEYRDRKSIAPSNNNDARAFNQYRFKVGLSIVDIGSINYADTEVTDYTVNADVNALDLENDFIDVLDNNSTTNVSRQDIALALPTSLHLNLDYSFTPKWYLNLNLNQGLVAKDEIFNNNRLNRITLTPRFETRVFGAYLPISHSALSQTAVGFGFRLGPLTLGSSSLVSNLLGDSAQVFNIFTGIKIPVGHKPAR
ncbi:DUF5723 family protein [Maribacter sp. 2307ULW6-5]|uniref:DUF5723 family protein n=1 Tax=Maribacter sp. 2307ULW6-5 TaxID=3386275 RepID=UPI0039BCA0FB